MEQIVYGARIKQVRELLGLTQEKLADGVSVDQSTIARIETENQQPSKELLEAISLQTGFLPSYFKKPPIDDFPAGSILFRDRRDVKAIEQTKIIKYGEFFFEFFAALERKVKRKTGKLPSLDKTPVLAAKLMRNQLGISPDVPINNLVNILEKNGILIFQLPERSKDLDAFSSWAGKDKCYPVIVLTSENPVDRLRFTLAHELGHLVLHKEKIGKSRLQTEANEFASEFLMPEETIASEFTKPVTINKLLKLKLRWRVSMQALAFHAFRIKAITSRQYYYLKNNLKLKEWIEKEPGSDKIPVEKPRLLSKMAETAYGSPINYKQLAEDTNLTKNHILKILSQYINSNDMQARKSKGSSPELSNSNVIQLDKAKSL